MYLQGILLHYFIQKKPAAESHRILIETYGNHALLETACRDWFRHFKNNDFDVEDKEHSGAPKKFRDKELEALLYENSFQVQAQLAESFGVDQTTVLKCLKELGMIQKQRHWVLFKLKSWDIKWLLVTCEWLLQQLKRKGFLNHIMTGEEKWIHYKVKMIVG